MQRREKHFSAGLAIYIHFAVIYLLCVFVYYSVGWLVGARCSQPHGTCPHTTSTYVLLHLAVVNLWRESCMNANLLAPQVQSYVKKVGGVLREGPTKD